MSESTVNFPSVPISHFNCPSLEPRPGARTFHREIMRWSEEIGLLRSAAHGKVAGSFGIGVLGYYAYGHLEREEDMRLLSQFLMWTTLIDDYATETEGLSKERVVETLDNLLRLLDLMDEGTAVKLGEAEEIVEHTYSARALQNIYARRNKLRPLLLSDFKLSLRHWFDSMKLAYSDKALPNVEQYLEVRVWDGATMLYCDAFGALCSEFGEGPLQERQLSGSGVHFTFNELKRLAAKHIASVNDVVALRKEYERGDLNNLCMILHRTQGLDIASTLDASAKLVNNLWDAFQSLKQSLPLPDSPLERRLIELSVETMERWMVGHLHWYYTEDNQRYSGEFSAASLRALG